MDTSIALIFRFDAFDGTRETQPRSWSVEFKVEAVRRSGSDGRIG